MSSDVYIVIWDSSRGWNDLKGDDGPIDSMRVGHLGTLSYFELDMVAFWGILSGAFQLVNEHVVATIPFSIIRFHNVNQRLIEDTTPEYRESLYGYCDPDWNDVAEPKVVSEFLTEHIGKPWTITVD